jgi:hypothetical protein
MPQNMATGEPEESEQNQEPPPFVPSPQSPDDDEEDEEETQEARARQFVTDAAARVVRREIAALTRGTNGGGGAAVRFAKDPRAWRKFVDEYYLKHAAHVAEVMRISRALAATYCAGQAAALKASGIGIMESWQTEIPPRLAALAMKGASQC